MVNIGLNAGAELVGITVLRSQSEERWFYRAIGPVTNIAARLCELAEQGKILVSGDMAAWGAGTRGLRAVGRRATVTADPGVADASLAGAVEAAGYRARVRERRALREGQRFPAGGEVYDLMVIGGARPRSPPLSRGRSSARRWPSLRRGPSAAPASTSAACRPRP